MRCVVAANWPTRLFVPTLAVVVLAMMGVVVSAALGPSTAYAHGELEITTNSHYQVQPALSVVTVVVTSTYVNTAPDTREGDYVQQNVITGAVLPVPHNVGDVAVTSDGAPLRFTREPAPNGLDIDLVKFDFNRNVFYGEQMAVEMRYALEGGQPRDETDGSRVNSAFVGFETWAVGDPGKTTLEIELPVEFELDASSTIVDAPSESDGITRTYRLGGDNLDDAGLGGDDGLVWAWVSATNTANLAVADIEVSGATISILAWPDDPEWAAHAESTVRDGVPYLEATFGSAWPQTDTEIRESGTPYSLGYAGWFDRSGDIEVGEDLDQEVMMHELSHAWLRTPTLNERWLTEGLAQHVAAAGVVELFDRSVTAPSQDAFADPLLAWAQPTTIAATSIDESGYDESWYTVDAIFAVAGDDKIADLLDAAADNATNENRLHDWNVLLNVTEPAVGDEATDSTEISGLLVEHVLGQPEIDEVSARNSTRAARADLLETAEEWGVPTSVDAAIEGWSFADADQMIEWAEDALGRRDALIGHASDEQVEVGTDTLRNDYMGAQNEAGFQKVQQRADALSQSVDHVTEARAAVDEAGGPLYSIGSWFADSPSNHLDTAEAALANGNSSVVDTESAAAVAAVNAAPERGRARAIGALVVLVLLLVLSAIGSWLRARRRAESPSVTNEVPVLDSRNDAAQTVAAVSGIAHPATPRSAASSGTPDESPDLVSDGADAESAKPGSGPAT